MVFKSKAVSSISNSSGSPTTISDTVSSSTTHVIVGLTVSNKSASNITATVTFTKNGGSAIHLVKDAPIAVGGTLVLIGGDQKIVAEEGDLLKAYASAATAGDVILSYLIGD